MSEKKDAIDFARLAGAASAGDKAAAGAILEAVQDGIYELALRMLGHPADAEDAAQEILVIVLTHLGSFRGESAFRTWVWRIAANHLGRVRRGRRETITLPMLEERLQTGLRDEPTERRDPEAEVLTRELHLRCTEGMLLGLDRELRVAYVLGAIMGLSGEEAAEVLEVDQATYRKRLSRARERLFDFLREWCGVFAAENPCRCSRQVDSAIERGLLAPDDLYLSRQRVAPKPVTVARATDELLGLVRVAEVLRGPSAYLAPDTLVKGVRGLLDTARLELLIGD
jgi:RNA polymerase sigma factor (sigma-70 family)